MPRQEPLLAQLRRQLDDEVRRQGLERIAVPRLRRQVEQRRPDDRRDCGER
jgi:hypothetical protein